MKCNYPMIKDSNGKCVQKCPIKTYYDKNTKNCLKCYNGC